MKKVLFIEHITHAGHINFNEIYIDNLIKQGANVKLVFQKSYTNSLKYDKSLYEKTIPNCLYVNSSSPLIERFFYILQLLYLKLFVNMSSYDMIILSCYDEIALQFVPFKRKMFLINHDNARGLDNKLKAWCIKNISTKHNHIVFNEYIKNKFKENNINNVYVVSHGCVDSINKSLLGQSIELNILSEKLLDHSYKHIIFSPSAAADSDFFKELFVYPDFLDFLALEKVLFIIRNDTFKIDNNNLLVINDYLSKKQYELLFLKSEIILINYPISFKYRVSGVFFEGCANSKKILIRNNPAFMNYYSFFNYNPSFATPNELLEKIKLIIGRDDLKCIIESNDLTPNFNEIINL